MHIPDVSKIVNRSSCESRRCSSGRVAASPISTTFEHNHSLTHSLCSCCFQHCTASTVSKVLPALTPLHCQHCLHLLEVDQSFSECVLELSSLDSLDLTRQPTERYRQHAHGTLASQHKVSAAATAADSSSALPAQQREHTNTWLRTSIHVHAASTWCVSSDTRHVHVPATQQSVVASRVGSTRWGATCSATLP